MSPDLAARPARMAPMTVVHIMGNPLWTKGQAAVVLPCACGWRTQPLDPTTVSALLILKSDWRAHADALTCAECGTGYGSEAAAQECAATDRDEDRRARW